MFRQPTGKEPMAKESNGAQVARESAVSIIGPGMKLVGNCDTEGTLRIEGSVEGTVRAGKAIVVGKDGHVKGDLFTQDAIIGGTVKGTIVAESRLELQTTCIVEGEIRARRVKLDEGGQVRGNVQVGDVKAPAPELRKPDGFDASRKPEPTPSEPKVVRPA